jgi:CRISPR-associated protein Cmr4
VFAYATCPLVLERLAEDFTMAGIPVPDPLTVGEKALITSAALKVPNSDKVILEEYTYDVEINEPAKKLAEQIAAWLGKPKDEYLLKNLIVLPNDEFADFVQNATEIITRIKINPETGTVAKGALFTEELLPTETVMYSLAMASSIFLPQEDREKSATVKAITGDEGEYLLGVIEENKPKYIQIGGDATIGKGLVSVNIVKGGEN